METYIARFSAWAPGIKNLNEWNEWACNKRNILPETISPRITYTDSGFRRRLSQISKMTIQVIHDLLPLDIDTKILFFSFRGELSREYQLYKMLSEQGEISPAAFSLSGFNTPVALASITFGLKGGYSALYPVNNSFFSCLKAAQSSLYAGKTREIVFVYADEKTPDESMFFSKEAPEPLAFGMLLSKDYIPSILLSSIEANTEEDNPAAFLKQLILRGKPHFISSVQESD